MKRYKILPIVCVVMIYTGCSGILPVASETAVIQEERTAEPAEESEELVYEGNILSNSVGYETEAQKLVIFRGNHQTETFEVVDCKTEETVYRGTILEKEYNLKSEELTAYGDFSKVSEAGEYYIKAEDYGISRTFEISDTQYSEMLDQQISYFKKNSSQKEDDDAAIKAADIMLAYTYFKSQYTEEDAKEMPAILQETQKELQELLASKKTSGVKTAALAMAVNLFSPYDQEFSIACQTRAEEDFPALKEEQIVDELYWAAAELYKLTGKSEYAAVIDYHLEHKSPRGFGKTAVGYYGTLAYLTTIYRTDVDQCTKLMEQLFDDAIDIVERSSADGYKISHDDSYQEDDAELLLQNARLLTLMNVISKSKDYVLGVENHLDYLCGRNPFEICYFNEENQVYQTESCIFILSGLKDSYESEEVKQ